MRSRSSRILVCNGLKLGQGEEVWGGEEQRPSTLMGAVLGLWEVGPYEENRARKNSWRWGVEVKRMLEASDV